MKRPIFGCGWKMYFKDSEAIEHANILADKISVEENIELYVLPSFTVLREVSKILKDTSISVGAQNMSWNEKGAYTGEVSVLSLKEMDIKYVEIGHSERRKYFAETDKTINKKLKKALEYDLVPVFCIGENANEKNNNLTEEVLTRQIQNALEGIGVNDAKKIIFAYEPVWAIGKSDAANVDYVEVTHKFIRSLLRFNYSSQINDGEEFKLVYGGSVSTENAADLIEKPNIDGIFVGRASLDPNGYFEILNIVKNNSK